MNLNPQNLHVNNFHFPAEEKRFFSVQGKWRVNEQFMFNMKMIFSLSLQILLFFFHLNNSFFLSMNNASCMSNSNLNYVFDWKWKSIKLIHRGHLKRNRLWMFILIFKPRWNVVKHLKIVVIWSSNLFI